MCIYKHIYIPLCTYIYTSLHIYIIICIYLFIHISLKILIYFILSRFEWILCYNSALSYYHLGKYSAAIKVQFNPNHNKQNTLNIVSTDTYEIPLLILYIVCLYIFVFKHVNEMHENCALSYYHPGKYSASIKFHYKQIHIYVHIHIHMHIDIFIYAFVYIDLSIRMDLDLCAYNHILHTCPTITLANIPHQLRFFLKLKLFNYLKFL
jgi:hypothetical protein